MPIDNNTIWLQLTSEIFQFFLQCARPIRSAEWQINKSHASEQVKKGKYKIKPLQKHKRMKNEQASKRDCRKEEKKKAHIVIRIEWSGTIGSGGFVDLFVFDGKHDELITRPVCCCMLLLIPSICGNECIYAYDSIRMQSMCNVHRVKAITKAPNQY